MADSLPVMRSSWALMVRRLSQAGSPHSLSRPLQAAVASSCPSGEKAQSTRGRSSPRSLLMAVTCSHRVGYHQEGVPTPCSSGDFGVFRPARGCQSRLLTPQAPQGAVVPSPTAVSSHMQTTVGQH